MDLVHEQVCIVLFNFRHCSKPCHNLCLAVLVGKITLLLYMVRWLCYLYHDIYVVFGLVYLYILYNGYVSSCFTLFWKMAICFMIIIVISFSHHNLLAQGVKLLLRRLCKRFDILLWQAGKLMSTLWFVFFPKFIAKETTVKIGLAGMPGSLLG